MIERNFRMAELYGNDRITQLLDWLYIGGIENNVQTYFTIRRKVWIHFAHDPEKKSEYMNM